MSLPAYVLETCRGVKPAGCPHAALAEEPFVAALENLAAAAPVPSGLAALGRPLRHHEQFRLALCACPNGCTRPHVADLGLVAAIPVAVSPRHCTGCGACVTACPDAAISILAGAAGINADRCLGCGACAKACPEKAITAGPVAFRALLGGRLGRHPRLGLEPAKRFSPQAALALTKRCLEAHARHMRPGLRFADIVFPGGQPGLPAWVLS
jgi:dissimilatory sulfite reductase (desulfoviridin) alpha/beta subunit